MALATPNTKAIGAQHRARARTIEEAYGEIIEEHGRAKGKALIRRALQPVFGSLIQRGRSATPARTGRLRRGVMVRPKERRGFVFGAKFGYFVRRRVSGVLGAEFGNARSRAHAALRTAWRSEESRVEGDLADALDREVDRTAARATKRARQRMASARRR